ncbi:sensor histidine kinase [Stutzerimonas kirkiae]|uniref:histidine kinase n=1 Tax=Stutzerimonas kirkiae TaxID=2211392 RepID=A0A4Q9R698_9GAMM|nr:HAMP domain-containing sensor histidine kinase [Stutzerimonas kirkiae]TBU95560.1 sensor histidine kinase [Stutzerimonas kirkiae]TBV02498.1 sensor histidine kinase [Stutzerimonas kirkiae]TBV09165.1 sensor histidine kinase [Stutzerimonas kirkiae]TBV12144.1 sensor histidine kinase [Stutzerimonas kirkiae]
MSWGSTRNLRLLLNTSNFRQAATIAFICLLVALMSMVFSNHLLEIVMRSHVRDMILTDIRSQQLHGRLTEARNVAAALTYRQPFELRKDRHSIVFDSADQPLYGDARLMPRDNCPAPCASNWRHAELRDSRGRTMEILGLVVPLSDGGQYFSAYDLRPMLERTRIIPLLASASLLIILLSIMLISLPFSIRNLSRINRIRDALGRYASGDHSAMVPHDRQGDEFDQLGNEINQGLHRINRLMDEVQNITSHIAHELRTPLTRLQGRLWNVAEMVDGAARDELQRAIQDGERIQNLFRAVMRIAEVETGRCAHQFEPIHARQLLEDIREYYLPLAEERACELVIQTADDCQLYGDRALLFQALANLIDNALKYGPTGKPITLAIHNLHGWSRISVSDQGNGIPHPLNDKAIERFQRLDTSGDTPGNGLGLTLTKAIADLHGGELTLEDNQPGLRAILRIRALQRD